MHMPAGAAGLHLPGYGARGNADAPPGRSFARRNGSQPPRPERAAPRMATGVKRGAVPGRRRRRLPLGWWIILLAGLSAVPWRQTQGVRLERELQEARGERAAAEVERLEWLQHVQRLQSRERIVHAAADRLGLVLPGDSEVLLLPLEP